MTFSNMGRREVSVMCTVAALCLVLSLSTAPGRSATVEGVRYEVVRAYESGGEYTVVIRRTNVSRHPVTVATRFGGSLAGWPFGRVVWDHRGAEGKVDMIPGAVRETRLTFPAPGGPLHYLSVPGAKLVF